jgi:signal transduction histidine kinase
VETLTFSGSVATIALPALSTPVVTLGLALNLAALIVWSNLASKGRRKKRSTRDRRLQYHVRLGLGLSSTAAAAVARRAEDKARQKTQVLGYLGHDLRAPLATLAGYLKLLRQSGTPEQQVHLLAMERSVGYQFGLIEQTLRYAKSELQPFTLVARATSLPDTLREIADFAVTLCHASGNAFEFHPPRFLPALVYFDDLRLRQALFNLLSNAAQFTRQGLITLRVGAEQRQGGWHLDWAITDNGSGIAPEQQANIFKAFEQARTSPGGAGLGLFIVDRIVVGMGGELSFASSPGRGTTFTFSSILQSADKRQVCMEPFSMACPPPVADDWAAPPLMARLQLARFAHNGEVGDIDSWLRQTTDDYPQCTDFLGEIRKAAGHFDLDRIRTLALLGTTEQQRAAPG